MIFKVSFTQLRDKFIVFSMWLLISLQGEPVGSQRCFLGFVCFLPRANLLALKDAVPDTGMISQSSSWDALLVISAEHLLSKTELPKEGFWDTINLV